MPARDRDDLTPGPAGEDPPARAGRVAQQPGLLTQPLHLALQGQDQPDPREVDPLVLGEPPGLAQRRDVAWNDLAGPADLRCPVERL
jgi:hypothetical protein